MRFYHSMRLRSRHTIQPASVRLVIDCFELPHKLAPGPLQLLVNDLILMLEPRELAWTCGRLPSCLLSQYPPYRTLHLTHLTVALHRDTDLEMLVNLLQLLSSTLQHALVLLCTPRHGSTEPDPEGWLDPTPRWINLSDKGGCSVAPLPNLRRLVLDVRWSRRHFGQGESATIQSMLAMISKDCILEVYGKYASGRSHTS